MQIWEKVSQAATEFDTKDWVIISIGALALVVAIIALFRRTGGRRLALRQQLTQLLLELAELNLESSKVRERIGNYPAAHAELLNHKRRFVALQAAEVARHIKSLVSPYEKIVLAQSFAEINDHVQTERFFRSAANASSKTARGSASRAFARYFFGEGRGAEGRQYYTRALKSFKGKSDRVRIYRAHTYEEWSRQERAVGDLTEADRLKDLARHDLEAVRNSSRREAELKRFEDSSRPSALSNPESAPALTPPPSTSISPPPASVFTPPPSAVFTPPPAPEPTSTAVPSREPPITNVDETPTEEFKARETVEPEIDTPIPRAEKSDPR